MRKKLLRSIFLVSLSWLVFSQCIMAAENLPIIDVYKDPNCGCCKLWIEHMEKNGFTVRSHTVADAQSYAAGLGVPNKFGSCHVAKVGKFLVVGHVPADDVKQLLHRSPHALGLSVPGMPGGSPGMESLHKQPFDTLLIQGNGDSEVFAHH